MYFTYAPVICNHGSYEAGNSGNFYFSLYEPQHDKTNEMSVRPAKTKISWASAQSDQSLRCALNG